MTDLFLAEADEKGIIAGSNSVRTKRQNDVRTTGSEINCLAGRGSRI
jgi:hypothetical protein